MRKLPNGDMFAPSRGKPPEVPEGYIRDPGDPYLFHLVLEPCIHRVAVAAKRSCCNGMAYYTWCGKSGKKVTAGDCDACTI